MAGAIVQQPTKKAREVGCRQFRRDAETLYGTSQVFPRINHPLVQTLLLSATGGNDV